VILELPTTLSGRYEVKRFLGAGSFAETYEAIDTETGQTVAIKLLRSIYVNDRETLTRFEREAKATSEIEHPNVVRTLDYRMDGPNPFLAMEYVSGPNLKTLLFESGSFSPAQSVTHAVQILAGLDAIHQRGMVHRDIKPHNILTDPELGARLSDFGIARALDQTGLTRTGTALGTATYMAPEQATGKGVTPSTDLYAVGVMMFEMLTGETPFKGNDPLEVLYQQVHQMPPPLREYNPEIPEWLERITLRAMSKEPADRFQSANEMIRALNNPDRSEDDTRAMDPALIAAQAATAAMPLTQAREPRPRRNIRAVPEASPRQGSPPIPVRKRSTWYRTPAFILLALVLIGAAIAGLYALGTGDRASDEEPSTIIEEAADDESLVEDEEPAEPDTQPEEEQPAEPEPPPDDPLPEPESEPAPEEEQPATGDEGVEEPDENEESEEGGPQGNGPPDHADGAPGQGNGNPGQGDGNPGQGNN
jgi:eukaryotic-like serine/threonine-protein kinase